jgi:hypothetical protein
MFSTDIGSNRCELLLMIDCKMGGRPNGDSGLKEALLRFEPAKVSSGIYPRHRLIFECAFRNRRMMLKDCSDGDCADALVAIRLEARR